MEKTGPARQEAKLTIYKDGVGSIHGLNLESPKFREFDLQPGTMLLFRQDIMHLGCSYADWNLRYFTYIDLKDLKRQDNATLCVSLAANMEPLPYSIHKTQPSISSTTTTTNSPTTSNTTNQQDNHAPSPNRRRMK